MTASVPLDVRQSGCAHKIPEPHDLCGLRSEGSLVGVFDARFQVLPDTKDVLQWELHYSLVRVAVDDMDYHSMRGTIECICEFTVATEHVRLVERMDCPPGFLERHRPLRRFSFDSSM